MNTITITEYLNRKGIDFRESGGELVTKCLFAGCDQNSRPNEAHLYFNPQTTQYDCKKCGAQGNIVTLCKYLGDGLKDIRTGGGNPKKEAPKRMKTKTVALTTEYVEKLHTAIPTGIRTYLNGRGISNGIIDRFKLGWGEFYGRNWITIPVPAKDGSWAMLKLRRDPEVKNDEQSKMKVWPLGATHEIYNWQTLKDESEIVLCEGEFDCLALLSAGIPAVTGTGGAGTFKPEWVNEFSGLKSVTVCYDNDEAGEKGAKKAVESLKGLKGPEVRRIRLPDMGEGLKDVTDYLTNFGGNLQTLMSLAGPVDGFDAAMRIKRIAPPAKAVSIEEWRETVRHNFPHFLFAAEAALSVMTQILINDVTNPFALVLVDVPSSGKTITINFFDGLEGLTYASDKFTPAAFVSNSVNVKREDLPNIDLLPRIRHKMLLIRDFATIFSKREDDLNECLGVLTRVLDGEGYKTDSGIHGGRGYDGDWLFMMLAATTPIPPRVWRMMGSLGSRLFFLNMASPDKGEDELADQLLAPPAKEKELKCRATTKQFLHGLWSRHQDGIEWDRAGDPRDCLITIGRFAALLARLRGVVGASKEKVDSGVANVELQPQIIEKPDRINQLFYNLCRGHAVACGRRQISQEDLRLVAALSLDSAPPTRAKIMRLLIVNGGKAHTPEVERLLGCSKTAALSEMKIMRSLGICTLTDDLKGVPGQPGKVLGLAEKYHWLSSTEYVGLFDRKTPSTESVDKEAEMR